MPMRPTILVCADEHPAPDDPWVIEQAAAQASGYGWTLGSYVETVNMQGRPGLSGIMYHVFLGVLP